MFDELTLKVYVDKLHVDVVGIDMPMTTILYRTNKYIVLKEPGHNYWSGRGEQSYAPTTLWVMEIIEREDRTLVGSNIIEVIKARRIIDFPARGERR